jgi:hypothetical protein
MITELEANEQDAGEIDRLEEPVRRAQQGDVSVLPELQQALDNDASIWRRVGDLAAQSQAAWLQLLAGQDLFLLEAVRRKQEQWRDELAGPNPSPLERLLVEQIVATWLQIHFADATYAQAKDQPHATPAVLRELMKRQESSSRRHLAAIRQLAVVRKLLRPALSPLDLAMRPVAETTAPRPDQTRSRSGNRVATN